MVPEGYKFAAAGKGMAVGDRKLTYRLSTSEKARRKWGDAINP